MRYAFAQMSPTPTVFEIRSPGGMFLIFFAIFAVFAIGSLVVWIWALVDAIQVPDDSMYRSGTKIVWVLVIVFLQLIGAIVYLAIGRPAKGSAPQAANSDSSGLPPPP
jgi:type VI protein secretion system component VasK